VSGDGPGERKRQTGTSGEGSSGTDLFTGEFSSRISSEFGARLIHIVTSGVLLLVLTRVLGPNLYGLLALSIAVFTFSRFLSESGLHWSAARYIAEYKDDDPARAATVVVVTRRIVFLTSGLVAIGLVVAAGPLSRVLEQPGIYPLLIAGSGVVFFYSIHRFNRHIIQGYEAIETSATLHMLEGVITVGIVAGAVLYRPTALVAVLGYVAAYGIVAVIGTVSVNRVGAIREHDLIDRRAIRWRVLRYNVPLSATRLSNVTDKQVDIILVGYFLAPAAVAYYALSKQIADFVRVPAASLGFALSPTYGSQKSQGNVESATTVFEESLRQTLILYIPACAGIVLVAETAIPAVFGDTYAGAIVLVQIFAAFIFFDALVKITVPGLDYLGRARARAIANAGTASANVVLNIILIPTVGVVGAAVATVLTTGIYAAVAVYIMYTELAFSIRRVTECMVKVSAITVVMGLAVFVSLGPLSGLLALLVSITIGVAVWIGACQLFDLIDFRSLYGHFLG